MTAPSFSFATAKTSRGLTPSGEGLYEFFNPLLPTTLVPASGFMLLLNGWNMNRMMADTTGYNGATTTALVLLQMRAPREPVAPLISAYGEGRVFRPGAKWRVSWYDSRTGQSSGLSPIPEVEINMGVESIAGATTYLGQQAWLNYPTANKPAQANMVRLWANSTQEDETWYLADSQPVGSLSYVLLTDNNTDEELFLNEAVITGRHSSTPAGMSWPEGLMWPVVKAWQHPSGRIFYYGIRRMARYWNLPIAQMTTGSDLVTVETTANYLQLIEQGRIGQRVKFYGSFDLTDSVADDVPYRIVKVESSTTFRIWPELQRTADVITWDTAVNRYFSIEDDRDARWTWMSEPGKPWLIDPIKVVAAGDDFDDGVLHWFSLADGRIYIQTKKRIYEATGSVSDNPALTTLFVPRAEEGTTGFFSGCVTPLGWVYYHETKGVRLFDGTGCYPLVRDVSTFQHFFPKTQIAAVEPSMMEETRVCYDDEHRSVLVSYVPIGQSTLREILYFATPERVWRGPYRERLFSSGYLKSTASGNVFTTADDLGNLTVREDQIRDVVPALSGYPAGYPFGTVGTVVGKRVFSDTASGAFDNDSDERLRGSPIWFTDNTGIHYRAFIADVLSGTQLELDGPPVAEDGTTGVLTSGWSYYIGAIRWSLLTSYLDSGGDPVSPVEMFKLNVRFRRGTTSETFEAGLAEDANGTYAGVRTSATSETAPTRDVNGAVHGELRLKREGACFQLRVRGLAKKGDPEIVQAVLLGEEREGALAP